MKNSGKYIYKVVLLLILVLFVFGGQTASNHVLADTLGLDFETSTLIFSETITPTPENSPTVTLEEFTSTSTITQTAMATSSLSPTSTLTAQGSFPTPVLQGAYVADEVILKLEPARGEKDLLPCFADLPFRVGSRIEELRVWVLKIPSGRVGDALVRAQNCAGVLYAEPNYLARSSDTFPNDPIWSNRAGLLAIRAPQGWDFSTGSPAVIIAIVDTGVDLAHPDLAAKLVPGYDFVHGNDLPQDDNGHGTHVAGIAAAIGNNGIGIAGVSWGAKIMPVKVLDSNSSGSYEDIAAGIVWAVDHGAHVINLSLGGTMPSAALEDAVNYAYAKGVVQVAAAGNTGSAMTYPARYYQVISVGFVDENKIRAPNSSTGAELDLMAPGVSIYSTWLASYQTYSGSSMAAPFVSGLAAILRGLPVPSSPDGIAFAMESTAEDLGATGRDNSYGFGLIQMDKAILSFYPDVPTLTPTSTATPASTMTPTKTATFRPTSTPLSSSGSGLVIVTGKTLITTPTPLFVETTKTAIIDFTPAETSTIASMLSPAPSATLPEEQPQGILVEPRERATELFLPCLGLMCLLTGVFLLFMIEKYRRKE